MRQHQFNLVPRLSWSISSIFQRKFTLSVRHSLKSKKKSLKTHIFGVQGHSKWSTLVPPESLSTVPVMISRKSVSICNRFHARLVNSSRNHAFWRGTQIWCMHMYLCHCYRMACIKTNYRPFQRDGEHNGFSVYDLSHYRKETRQIQNPQQNQVCYQNLITFFLHSTRDVQEFIEIWS